MKIIEYEDKYLESVKDLLVELEEYIVSIDKDELDQVHKEYREKMAIIDLLEVKNNNGICYLAIENDQVLGLIMGTIPEYEEYDYCAVLALQERAGSCTNELRDLLHPVCTLVRVEDFLSLCIGKDESADGSKQAYPVQMGK